MWQGLALFDYGPHWKLIAVTVVLTSVGIVTFGSIVVSVLPLVLKRLGFDPATASAPLVATLVDGSGIASRLLGDDARPELYLRSPEPAILIV